MARDFQQQQTIRERLGRERGTLHKQGELRVALVYPSPYHVGMSSLGYQTIYRIINTESAHSAERAFLPDEGRAQGPLLTYESESPVGDCDVVAFSLAYELELPGLIQCLEDAGFEALAKDRSPETPIVLIGGPLTFSNPGPAGPFADVIVMGEGESLILRVLDLIAEARSKDAVLERLAAIPGLFVPRHHGATLPAIAAADDALLPAYSQIITPDTELSNMHLVEAERGCHRRCTFCVMRRSTNGGMRTAPIERVLATIPEHAERVGLVGAAVTDHPELVPLVEAIVESGRGLGISSLRADRLTPALMELLHRGGYRTLTVASDGASERLREVMMKSIREHHLRHAANMAAQFGMRTLKLYMMLGVPGESDDDLEELVRFSRELAGIAPLALTLSPFVAKKNTPMDGDPFAGVDVIDQRLAYLRKELRSVVDLRSTSARWAWIEYALAQGGPEMGLATLEAARAGGRFADWKRAIGEHAPRFLDGLKGAPSGRAVRGKGKRRREDRGRTEVAADGRAGSTPV